MVKGKMLERDGKMLECDSVTSLFLMETRCCRYLTQPIFLQLLNLSIALSTVLSIRPGERASEAANTAHRFARIQSQL